MTMEKERKKERKKENYLIHTTVTHKMRGKLPQQNTSILNTVIYIKITVLHDQVGLILRIQAWLSIQNSNKCNI